VAYHAVDHEGTVRGLCEAFAGAYVEFEVRSVLDGCMELRERSVFAVDGIERGRSSEFRVRTGQSKSSLVGREVLMGSGGRCQSHAEGVDADKRREEAEVSERILPLRSQISA
jgi:hypothetical protein